MYVNRVCKSARRRILIGTRSKWALVEYSQFPILPQRIRDKKKVWRTFLNYYLASGGVVIDDPSESKGSFLSGLVSGAPGFDCIDYCLFRQAVPWVLEDLAPIDIWLIGIWAHVNASFRKALGQYFSSFRSSFKKIEEGWGIQVIDSVFNLDTIATQVKNASFGRRVEFLQILSR